MAVRLSRRTFLAGAAVTLAMPAPAFPQGKPVKIGLLTVKTGPLAAGGIQMEQGTIRFLKDKNYTMAGRTVELVMGLPVLSTGEKERILGANAVGRLALEV